MTLTLKELMPGMGDQVSTMAAFKPNMYKLTQDMGMPGMGSIEVISNGTNTWSTESQSKIYSEGTASTSFADSPELNLLLGGTPGEFFFSLLSADPEDSFLSISRVSTNGPVEVDGTTYDSFILHADPSEDIPAALQIEIAVEQGDHPWVHHALHAAAQGHDRRLGRHAQIQGQRLEGDRRRHAGVHLRSAGRLQEGR